MRVATPVSSNGSEKMEERQITILLEGSAQNSRRTSIGRYRTKSRTSPFSSSFETAMTTSGHHVVRGNEWKVPSPKMMTYMFYEIYTYPYMHTMYEHTHTHTHTHTHSNTSMYMYAQLWVPYRDVICLSVQTDDGPG